MERSLFWSACLCFVLFLPIFKVSGLEPDAAAHFGISFAASMSCQLIVKRSTDISAFWRHSLCFAATGTIGIGKEFVDSSRPTGRFSHKDVGADLAGAAAASGFMFVYELSDPPPTSQDSKPKKKK